MYFRFAYLLNENFVLQRDLIFLLRFIFTKINYCIQGHPNIGKKDKSKLNQNMINQGQIYIDMCLYTIDLVLLDLLFVFKRKLKILFPIKRLKPPKLEFHFYITEDPVFKPPNKS
jgi:hypothetical protein